MRAWSSSIRPPRGADTANEATLNRTHRRARSLPSLFPTPPLAQATPRARNTQHVRGPAHSHLVHRPQRQLDFGHLAPAEARAVNLVLTVKNRGTPRRGS